ncbi:ethanolamine:proton symporter, EAT family [Filimonas lacunae]|uniref:Ethanolamine:proton symporter, EAT family n=1 Tax=Filimonas lacunae TaxID=477680 RepID=A0A173MFV4_9BACT|nr:ethanolamine permease [Filimonas lacunae]BAV06359.1 ethanolamine permease [Filimonas lacunae]SIT26610.1 ethanolamine:proton symporter, EAT family [Filimonas lacunae]
MPTNASELQKVLRPIHIWAIAVGLVISGEYFGWNYGWGTSGTVGFLIATLIITVLYVCFIFSFTELTTAVPHAGGPFAYAYRAMGPLGGLIAGYASLIEFLFAAPAIAYALGSYVHFLYPSVPVLYTAIGCYILFTFINLLGIKESAVFSVIVTLLAVVELLIYLGIVAPAFKWVNFMAHALPVQWSGLFAALPFAIWLYVCIEGVAMVAEEVRDIKKDIPRGYISGILTLTVLALAVMIFTGGITDWRLLSNIDYPLPESIGIVLGKNSSITRLFAGIGLFGLIASFHSIIISYSRQLFALGRSNFLPAILARVHSRFKTPHLALFVGGVLGLLAIRYLDTQKLVIISTLGAVVMYITSMISLFVLRVKEPELHRPFTAPLYPFMPAVALVLSLVCCVTICWFYPMLSALFFIGLVIVTALFYLTGRHRIPSIV